MNLNDVLGRNVSLVGRIGPVKYINSDGRKITVIDGPFRVTAFKSGPLRDMIVQEEEVEEQEEQTRSSRGRTSSVEHLV